MSGHRAITYGIEATRRGWNLKEVTRIRIGKHTERERERERYDMI